MTAALERGEWSAGSPSLTLPPGKTWYPFYRRLGGPPRPVCMGGKSRPHKDSIPDHPASSSVTILTELPGPRILLMVYSKAEMKKLMSIQHLLVSNRF